VSESSDVVEFVSWFRKTYPDDAHTLRVSQSGGYKGRGLSGAIRMRQIKAMGGIKGESDFLFAIPRKGYGALVVEYKTLNGTHPLTDEQQAYLEAHARSGNMAVCCRGLEALTGVVRTYIEMPRAGDA